MSAKSEKRRLALFIPLLLAGCQRAAEPSSELLENPAAVTQQRLLDAQAEGSQWITPGGAWSGQHFSRLKQINVGNAGRLKLAWSAALGASGPQPAAPLFIDGVLYMPVDGSRMLALDAVSGTRLWQYDAGTATTTEPVTCCADVSRSPAAWQGRVFMITRDARLVAIDARNGTALWSTPSQARTSITMAPRVADGRVFVGAAVEGEGARSWMAAFDAATGREVWRFHTVPGNPSTGFENGAMKRAATTWQGQWWKSQTGGAVQDAALLDPDTGYLVFGTGGRPGSAGGLFASSLIALKAQDGAYVWHFQGADATAPLMAMDVLLDGKPRHVLVQPNANGLITMLDVATGELLREDVYAEARATEAGNGFAAFSPDTRLVYIRTAAGGVKAWNPVGRKLVWEIPGPAGATGGGLLATAGGIVFNAVGTALQVHDARTGELLWMHAASDLVAPPISFEQHGRQYVVVSTGGADAAAPARLLAFALDAVKLDEQKH